MYSAFESFLFIFYYIFIKTHAPREKIAESDTKRVRKIASKNGFSAFGMSYAEKMTADAARLKKNMIFARFPGA